MTDIVERLRDHNRHIRGRLIEGLTDLVIDDMVEAADKIARLRAALERLAELDEFVCGKPQTIEEVMNYTQFVARAALVEKE